MTVIIIECISSRFPIIQDFTLILRAACILLSITHTPRAGPHTAATTEAGATTIAGEHFPPSATIAMGLFGARAVHGGVKIAAAYL